MEAGGLAPALFPHFAEFQIIICVGGLNLGQPGWVGGYLSEALLGYNKGEWLQLKAAHFLA